MNILFVDEFVPEPDRNGSSLRALQIIESLRALAHKVTFVSRYLPQDSGCAEKLKKSGIEFYAGDVGRISSHRRPDPPWSFSEVLKKGNFDAAILTLWFWNDISIPEDYLYEIRHLSECTRIIVLTDDRHGLRQRLVAEATKSLLDSEAAIDHAKRERQIYMAADLVFAISALERSIVEEAAPSTPVMLIPFSVESSTIRADYNARRDVVYLGNFENNATRDAVAWFLEKVWPLIHDQQPEIGFTVAGNRAFAHVPARAPKNIRCVGHVSDLAQLLDQHRVFVAPIRFGTGIATKNITAMAHGIPVVTTTLGAQSIGLVSGSQAMLANTAEDFAAAVLAVYSDQRLWTNMVDLAHAHLLANFSHRSLEIALAEAMESVCQITPKQLPVDSSWLCSGDNSGRNKSTAPRRSEWFAPVRRAVATGELLFRQRRPFAAIDQFRRAAALCVNRGNAPYSDSAPVRRRLLRDFQRCYEAFGDSDRAARCDEEQSALTEL